MGKLDREAASARPGEHEEGAARLVQRFHPARYASQPPVLDVPSAADGVVRQRIGCLRWLLILVVSVVSGLGVTVGGFWPLGLGLPVLSVYALLFRDG